MVRYGSDLENSMSYYGSGWTPWFRVDASAHNVGPSSIACDNDFFEDSRLFQDHFSDPEKVCECLEGYFPRSPDCSPPDCLSFTDKPSTPGGTSCCQWKDYSTGEWVATGETRPCFYEMGDDDTTAQYFRFGAVPSTVFAQIVWLLFVVIAVVAGVLVCVITMSSKAKVPSTPPPINP